MNGCNVYKSGQWVKVKNLGYLLRNWKQIKVFKIFLPDGYFDNKSDEALLVALFKDGRFFTTTFASYEVLSSRFLPRPVFYDLPVAFIGCKPKGDRLVPDFSGVKGAIVKGGIEINE